MTVNELISELQTMPRDMLVFDSSNMEIENVSIVNEFYIGDSANPNAEPLTVVKLT